MKLTMLLTSYLLMVLSSHTFAATYSYEGGFYQNIAGPNYTTSMQITATFETATPLASNLPMTDITASLVSFSLNDGLQTINQNNAEILTFNVSTDANGVPVSWNISLWEAPVTNTPGEPVSGMDLYFNMDQPNNFVLQEQGFTEPCGASGASYCDLVALDTNFGGIFDIGPAVTAPGTWTVSGVGGAAPQPVPTNQTWAMLMLMGALLLGFVWQQRHQRAQVSIKS